MADEITCEECGAPLEDEDSVCTACGGGPASIRRAGSRGLKRLSLARLYSVSGGRTDLPESDETKDTPRENNVETEPQSPVDDVSEEVIAHDEPSPIDRVDSQLSDLTSGENGFSEEEVVEDAVDSSDLAEAESQLEEHAQDVEDTEGESSLDELDTILSGIAAGVAGEGSDESIWEEDSDKVSAVPVRKERLRIGEPVPRTKTNVEGLDEALCGGIPQGNIVLVSGTAGAMKSTFAYYILYTNILSEGARGLYVTLEQTLKSLLGQMSELGMDPEEVGGSLRMFDMGYIRKHMGKTKKNWFRLFMKNLDNMKDQMGFDLLVIDSLEALEVLANFENRRADLFQLFEWLRDISTTTFIVTERTDCPFGKHLSHYKNEEEFLADGVINLALHSIGDIDVQRRLRCVKMRGTKHEPGYFSLMWDEGKFKVTKAVGR
ncbi:MAG: ATPase domain-containing protein [Thermoplasmata archaeon]